MYDMLITTNKDGFIANEDIVVYKKLERLGNSWRTPYFSCKVTLDSELLPFQGKPEIIEYSPYYNINGGVIHSHTWCKNDGGTYFKSIIPKGSWFWLGDDLSEIGSKRLYVTSEMARPGEKTDFTSLHDFYLDLLHVSGERTKWSPEVNPKVVRGIYAYDSQAIDINFQVSIFSEDPILSDQIGEEEMDFEGRERTRYLRQYHPEISILKKLSNDSYLPALGELSRALKNILPLNLTRDALGLESINYYYGFWSSTSCGKYFCGFNPYWQRESWVYQKYSSWENNYVLPFIEKC